MKPAPYTLFLSSLLFGAACASASGDPHGGDPLFDAGPPVAPIVPSDAGDAGGAITWTSLYADYFGPSGKASCAGSGLCHGTADQPGSLASNFTCGPSKDACYTSALASVVPQGGSQTPETSQLYTILRKTTGGGSMPKSSTFAFAPADLQRIAGWMKNGAKND